MSMVGYDCFVIVVGFRSVTDQFYVQSINYIQGCAFRTSICIQLLEYLYNVCVGRCQYIDVHQYLMPMNYGPRYLCNMLLPMSRTGSTETPVTS